jgi:PAS domain S-box-containing protein
VKSLSEAVDRISRSGDAVFVMDSRNRIIRWNKACESLLGFSARSVMGKPCHEVVRGRDGNDNEYCQQSCPAAHQARDGRARPVCPFVLNVPAADGSTKTVSSSLFSVPSYHSALATLVHVFREATLPTVMGRTNSESREPLEPFVTSGGEVVAFTAREREILGCLVEGLSTAAIGLKLFISAVTVRNHVNSILHKLDVHTRIAAVAFAHQHEIS